MQQSWIEIASILGSLLSVSSGLAITYPHDIADLR
jgi:hypothetical protein